MHGVCSDPSDHFARSGLHPQIVLFLSCSSRAFSRAHQNPRPYHYLQTLGLVPHVDAVAQLRSRSLGSSPRFDRRLRAKLVFAWNQHWRMSPRNSPVTLPLLP
jgi:hypothetical protein